MFGNTCIFSCSVPEKPSYFNFENTEHFIFLYGKCDTLYSCHICINCKYKYTECELDISVNHPV